MNEVATELDRRARQMIQLSGERVLNTPLRQFIVEDLLLLLTFNNVLTVYMGVERIIITKPRESINEFGVVGQNNPLLPKAVEILRRHMVLDDLADAIK